MKFALSLSIDSPGGGGMSPWSAALAAKFGEVTASISLEHYLPPDCAALRSILFVEAG